MGASFLLQSNASEESLGNEKDTSVKGTEVLRRLSLLGTRGFCRSTVAHVRQRARIPPRRVLAPGEFPWQRSPAWVPFGARHVGLGDRLCETGEERGPRLGDAAGWGRRSVIREMGLGSRELLDTEGPAPSLCLRQIVLGLLVEPAFSRGAEGDRQTDGHLWADTGAAVQDAR